MPVYRAAVRGGIRNIIQTNVFSRGGIIKAVRGDIRGTSKPGTATRVCRDKRVVQVCRQIFAVIYNVRYPTELSVRGGYWNSRAAAVMVCRCSQKVWQIRNPVFCFWIFCAEIHSLFVSCRINSCNPVDFFPENVYNCFCKNQRRCERYTSVRTAFFIIHPKIRVDGQTGGIE